MTDFEREFFKKLKFDEDEIKAFLESARHDLEIAEKDTFPEVKFTYSYQTLIKLGIVLAAKIGSVKVRSIPGHHVKILEKASQILGDEDFLILGNAMRMKRNTDLYGGAKPVSQKEAEDYLHFVKKMYRKTKDRIGF